MDAGQITKMMSLDDMFFCDVTGLNLTLSFPRSQKSFVIDKRLVNLLVKLACRKSYTAHL
jgi:hypothetical protein